MKPGGNGEKKGLIIDTVKYDHLALVYIPGRDFPYIGQKFGRELKRPFIFLFGEPAVMPGQPPPAPGTTPYRLLPIPFLGKEDSLFIEGDHMWHFLKVDVCQHTYHGVISPIIQP